MHEDNEIIRLIKSAARDDRFEKITAAEMERLCNLGAELSVRNPDDNDLVLALDQFRAENQRRKKGMFLRRRTGSFAGTALKLLKVVVQILLVAFLGYISSMIILLAPLIFETTDQMKTFVCVFCVTVLAALVYWLRRIYINEEGGASAVGGEQTGISGSFKKILFIVANIPPALSLPLWPFALFLMLWGVADSGIKDIFGLFLLLSVLFYPLPVYKGIALTVRSLKAGDYKRCLPGTMLAYSGFVIIALMFALAEIFNSN